MGTEITKPVDQKQQALIETVRATIFPNASDAELALFFHKCNVVGVNPLDQLIHPTKYKDSEHEGKFKVVFITSIDLLRAKSNEDGDCDGMDEPEFEGLSTYECEGQTYEAPDLCRVRIYKKGIQKPFVGVARWKEFYPGEKKGHMYRRMPHNQLAKCAEAQARRLGWPNKLNKLYTEEEMMQATEQLAGIENRQSTKPNVTPDQVKPRQAPPPASEPGWLRGVVKAAFSKSGTGKNGPWMKYSVTIGEKTYATFDTKLGDVALSLKGKDVEFKIEVSGTYENLMAIREYKAPPEPVQPPAPSTAPADPAVEDSEAFATTVLMTALEHGFGTEAAVNHELQTKFNCTVDTVPAEQQATVLNYFQSLPKKG